MGFSKVEEGNMLKSANHYSWRKTPILRNTTLMPKYNPHLLNQFQSFVRQKSSIRGTQGLELNHPAHACKLATFAPAKMEGGEEIDQRTEEMVGVGCFFNYGPKGHPCKGSEPLLVLFPPLAFSSCADLL